MGWEDDVELCGDAPIYLSGGVGTLDGISGGYGVMHVILDVRVLCERCMGPRIWCWDLMTA